MLALRVHKAREITAFRWMVRGMISRYVRASYTTTWAIYLSGDAVFTLGRLISALVVDTMKDGRKKRYSINRHSDEEFTREANNSYAISYLAPFSLVQTVISRHVSIFDERSTANERDPGALSSNAPTLFPND